MKQKTQADLPAIPVILSREGNDLVMNFYGLSKKKIADIGRVVVGEGAAHSAHHWAHTPNVIRLAEFDFFTYGTGNELIEYLSELLREYMPEKIFEFSYNQ